MQGEHFCQQYFNTRSTRESCLYSYIHMSIIWLKNSSLVLLFVVETCWGVKLPSSEPACITCLFHLMWWVRSAPDASHQYNFAHTAGLRAALMQAMSHIITHAKFMIPWAQRRQQKQTGESHGDSVELTMSKMKTFQTEPAWAASIHPVSLE